MLIGKRRISPSHAAWTTGPNVITSYEKSCVRYMVWQRRFEKEANIDPMYKAIGDIDEALHAVRLQQNGWPFQREIEFKHPMAGTEITIEGRLDFWIDHPEGPMITEKKSITSANRWRTIIKNGQFDTGHLAQLVSYMAIKKVPRGQLAYSFWKWSEGLDGFIVDDTRAFEVQLTPTGSITVDGQPFQYHVRDLQNWFMLVAKFMDRADIELGPRPQPASAWANPCKGCPLAESCNQYDTARNVAQFWHDTAHIEPRTGKAAEIIAPKLTKAKKGKKNESNQLSDSSNTDVISDRIRDKASADIDQED